MNAAARRLVNLVVVAAALACSWAAQAAYEFRSFDCPGAVSTQFWGINNSGQIVGIALYADGSTVNFTYETKVGGCIPVEATAAAPAVDFIGIGERGVLVGAASEENGDNSFGLIRNKNGSLEFFAHPPPLENTVARAVGSGLVTGYAYDDGGTAFVGFIYDPSNASFVDIAFPGMNFTIAQGIDGRGSVVGSTILPPDGAYYGSAPGEYGFLRDAGGAITLFRLNDSRTRARGINNKGVITGFINTSNGLRGFAQPVVAGPGYQAVYVLDSELLNVPGAVNTAPQAIDNAGTIVGAWNDGNPNGFQHGFIATQVTNGKK